MVAPTVLGPLERASLNHCPVGAAIILPEDGNRSSFRNVFFKKHQTMDKVQKHDSFKCNTLLSEPFKLTNF
jgi:hypothetical protein